MILKQEELLSRYFEHRMSADEEQNFLIQLAASDDLRTAFRSHLELQKAIRDDKDDLRSVAQVRTRTLTALGLSAAAVTPFIEQQLLRNQSERKQLPETASLSPKLPPLSRVGQALRSRSAMLGAGLVLGFASATMIFSSDPTAPSALRHPGAVEHRAVPATVHGESAAEQPADVPSNSSTIHESATADPSPSLSVPARETIHTANGLNTTPPLAHSDASHEATSAGSTNVQEAPTASHTPTVTILRPSTMRTLPAKVQKPQSTTKE